MLTITHYVLIYLVSFPFFITLDLLWIGVIARSFYQTRLGHLLGESVNWPAAYIFYAVFLLGVMFFATVPALDARDITKAMIYGALFGLFTYATYDLTNWATLRDWPASLTFVDIVWGAVLSGAVATATYWCAVTFIIK